MKPLLYEIGMEVFCTKILKRLLWGIILLMLNYFLRLLHWILDDISYINWKIISLKILRIILKQAFIGLLIRHINYCDLCLISYWRYSILQKNCRCCYLFAINLIQFTCCTLWPHQFTFFNVQCLLGVLQKKCICCLVA